MKNRYLYPNKKNKKALTTLEENLTTLLNNLKKDQEANFDDFYIINALQLQLQAQRFYLRDRDSLMAENIKILHQKYPENRIVFLANNTHCSSTDNYAGATGYFLKKVFKDDYVSIGTIANEGYYTAYDFALETTTREEGTGYGFFTSSEFTSKNVTSDNQLHVAPIGSIEHYLKGMKKKYLLLELPKEPLNIAIRDIGLVVRDCEQFSQINSNIYDYIIYLDRVNATKIIPY